MRTIVPEDSFWKINEFSMHKRYTYCQSIDIHLHGKKEVYFDDEDDMLEIMNESQKKN